MSMTSKQLITRSLPVKLTPDEVRAKGEQLALRHKEAGDIKANAKSVASSFKLQLEEIAGSADQLARDVRDRAEHRNVTCYERPDYEANVVRMYREDTGELVETRSMRIDERQSSLDVMLARGAATTIGEAARSFLDDTKAAAEKHAKGKGKKGKAARVTQSGLSVGGGEEADAEPAHAAE